MCRAFDMKICIECKVEKPVSDFFRDKENKTGYKNQCKVCKYTRRNKIGRKETKTQRRKWMLKSVYGITAQQFESMVIEQNNKCKLCGASAETGAYKTLYVDHNHVTGKIRSLLCGYCNTGLGMFKESPELLIKASQYVSGF